jgi:hypothetical protein
MDYYYYLIFFFIIVIIFRFYVKITYKFWAYQPVFHYYNLLYWIYPKGIINKELPESNKFCNFINITNRDFFDYNEKEIIEIVDLLRNHYNRNREANYLPTIDYFKNFFTGHTDKCFISVYNNPIYKLDNTKEKTDIKQENEIIGVITGKPISISIKKTEKLKAYYVDFLCVNREHREKNIAPQLIQTYEYTQRHKVTDHKISLFKREGKLTGIVPLTVYKTYMFNTKPINTNKIINEKLILINKINYHILTDFIDNNRNKFDCIVTVNKANLLNLINANIYNIYGILQDNRLIACYFYKINNIIYTIDNLYDKKKQVCESIDLLASVKDCQDEIFIIGFILSLNKYITDTNKNSKTTINYINVENISNNTIITQYLLNKSLKPKIISPMAYFFYNYVKRPLSSDNVLIIV